MSPPSSPRDSSGRVLGSLTILTGVVLGSALPVELSTGRGDTDDAAASLVWLENHPGIADLTAGLLLIGGTLLIVVALGLRRRLGEGRAGWAIDAATAFGVVAGTCYATAGALRSVGGSILYIGTFGREGAEAAYLAAHIVGNQALLPLAEIGGSGWLVAVGVAAFRRRLPGLVAVAVLPAVALTVLAAARLLPGLLAGDALGVGWLIHIANLVVGVPVGIVALGVALVVPTVWQRLGRAGGSGA
jgi:hypothetical protein